MAVVTLTWSTKSQDFPLSTVPGLWLVQMTGQPDQTPPSPVSIPYSLPPGDYVASVTRLDDQGLPLGSAATASFTVAATTAPLQVAQTVTVVVGV